jgi:anti-sigma regulatory factor (Ser/Thr protein kinase)
MMRRRSPTSLTFPANPDTPRRIRAAVRQLAADAHAPAGTIEDLAVAVSEAANNALRHTLTPTIRLTWALRNGVLDIGIHDLGVYRHEVPAPAPNPPEGWGFRLMTAMVEEVIVHPGTEQSPGTSVRLLKILAG